MPKLDKEKAASTSEAESSFGLLEEGVYVGTLSSVEVRGPGPSGYEYWVWEFTDLLFVDDEYKGVAGRQWVNTSLSPEAEWKLKEAFDAFGSKTTADTDKLLGEHCRLIIVQREIEAGKRMGEMGNQVDAMLPLEEEDAEAIAE